MCCLHSIPYNISFTLPPAFLEVRREKNEWNIFTVVEIFIERRRCFLCFLPVFYLVSKNIEAEGSKGQYVVCNHSNTTGLCDVIKQTIRLLFPFKIYRQIMKIGRLCLITTLQTLINAKLRQHMFWQCHENGLISISTIPHSLLLSFKLASLHLA